MDLGPDLGLTIFSGGIDSFGAYSDTIMEYNSARDEIIEVDNMIEKRSGHAISVVLYLDYSKWCQ